MENDRKENGAKAVPAQVTVFVCAVLVVILALLGTTLESARVSGLRFYFRMAAESATASVFSEYHSALLEKYHLFLLKDEGRIVPAAKDYMSYYEAPEKGLGKPGLHFYRFQTEEIGLENCVYALDESGKAVEDEIMGYAGYGIAESVADQVKDYFGISEQCQKVAEVAKKITGFAEEVFQLENHYKKLKELVGTVQAISEETASKLDEAKEVLAEYHGLLGEIEQLRARAEEGGASGEAEAFNREAEEKEVEMSHAKNELQGVLRQADGTKKKLQEALASVGKYAVLIEKETAEVKQLFSPVAQELEELKPQLSDELLKIVGEQSSVVTDYTEDTGKRKEQLSAVEESTSKLQQELKAFPDISSILSDPGWGAVLLERKAEGLRENGMIPWPENVETIEQEISSDLLDSTESAMDKGVLALILGDTSGLSEREISGEGLPSVVLGEERGDEKSKNGDSESESRDSEPGEEAEVGGGVTDSLRKNIVFNEYFLKVMPSYAARGDQENMSGFYDLEYLIGNGTTDRENLADTFEKLLLLRGGMNLVFLYGDQAKSQEALALATALTGITGLAPLISLVKNMILVAWAFSESVLDVKILSQGGKVPFFKKQDDWRTSLAQAALLGNGVPFGDSEKGMDYQGYLRLLLCLRSKGEKLSRGLDVIQWNIQQNDPGFYLKDCVYQAKLRITAQADGMFITLPAVRPGAEGIGGYRLTVLTEYGY